MPIGREHPHHPAQCRITALLRQQCGLLAIASVVATGTRDAEAHDTVAADQQRSARRSPRLSTSARPSANTAALSASLPPIRQPSERIWLHAWSARSVRSLVSSTPRPSSRTRRQCRNDSRGSERPAHSAARRCQRAAARAAGLLPVMRQQRGALVEVAARRLDRARHRRVHPPAPLPQLRAQRDLLRQRMLEGVLGYRVERLLVEELAPPPGRAERRRRAPLVDAPARSPDPASIGSANSCRSPRRSAAPASRAPAADRCAPRARPARWPAPRAFRPASPAGRRPALPSQLPASTSVCTTSSVKNGLPPVRAWIVVGQRRRRSDRRRAGRASSSRIASGPSGASGSCW